MILVTGAGGLNGFHLVSRLSEAGIPAKALLRRPANGRLAALKGVEMVQGDMLKPDTLAAALAGVDKAMLISSSTPDMVQVQSSFILAAKKAGVRHVVKLSGIVSDLSSPFRFARMHAEIEKNLEASGMAFTHLRAGEFMHSYFRQLPNILGKGLLLLPLETAKMASVDVADIAEIAQRVLTTPGHEGMAYRLTGPEALSMAEVAEKLSSATGKAVAYQSVPPEAARQAQLAAGMPPYLVDALYELFAERRKGAESQVYPDASALLGRPATSFLKFARRHAAIFRGEEPASKA